MFLLQDLIYNYFVGLKGLISSSRKRKIQIAASRQVIQTQSTFVKPAQLEPDTLKDGNSYLHICF